MKLINDPSIKAICFLKKNGDEKNCIYLVGEELVIIIRGSKHTSHLADVQRILLERKKLLGPIVAGGIIFPLAGLAFLGNISNSFLMMLIMIAGLFLFIYGVGGSLSLTIQTTVGPHHYFLRRGGKNIDDFINYINKKEYLNS